jgi:3-deoxy-D-manno-octulosonate 8-phosphate phosphatase (KDO 8-P phosphatase)
MAELNKNIKLIVIDYDGCIGNGIILLDHNGHKIRSYFLHDSISIANTIGKGYKIIIISSHELKFLKKKAKEWKVTALVSNIVNKAEWIKNYIKTQFLLLSQVAYFGCNINDLKLIKEVGLSGCPKNAHYKIKETVSYVCEFNGGEGAVYEFLELFNFNSSISKNINENKNNTNTNTNTNNTTNSDSDRSSSSEDIDPYYYRSQTVEEFQKRLNSSSPK